MAKIEFDRKKLRHCILNANIGKTASEIYEIVKPTEQRELLLSDLHKFCDSARIRKDLLPRILETYRVTGQMIRKRDFVRFLDDEVSIKETIALPDSLTGEQIAILSKLCRTMKSRKTQGAVSPHSMMTERSSISQLWVFVSRQASTTSRPTQLQISSLCTLASDLNLSFSSEELIDALFAFFGKQSEDISYEQFARLMECF